MPAPYSRLPATCQDDQAWVLLPRPDKWLGSEDAFGAVAGLFGTVGIERLGRHQRALLGGDPRERSAYDGDHPRRHRQGGGTEADPHRREHRIARGPATP